MLKPAVPGDIHDWNKITFSAKSRSAMALWVQRGPLVSNAFIMSAHLLKFKPQCGTLPLLVYLIQICVARHCR